MPKDKQYHLIAGALISGLFGFLFTPIIGIGIGVFAGVCKEVYDKVVNDSLAEKGLPPKHDVDFMDFTYTAVGAIFVGVIEMVML